MVHTLQKKGRVTTFLSTKKLGGNSLIVLNPDPTLTSLMNLVKFLICNSVT